MAQKTRFPRLRHQQSTGQHSNTLQYCLRLECQLEHNWHFRQQGAFRFFRQLQPKRPLQPALNEPTQLQTSPSRPKHCFRLKNLLLPLAPLNWHMPLRRRQSPQTQPRVTLRICLRKHQLLARNYPLALRASQTLQWIFLLLT